MEELIKKCTKCGDFKGISYFHKKKSCIYGVNSQCKECRNLDRNIRYSKNKKYISDKYKEKYSDTDNILKRRLYYKDRYKKNSESIKVAHKKCRDKLPDCVIRSNLISVGFPKEKITSELIQVQRLITLTKRLCRTSQN